MIAACQDVILCTIFIKLKLLSLRLRNVKYSILRIRVVLTWRWMGTFLTGVLIVTSL